MSDRRTDEDLADTRPTFDAAGRLGVFDEGELVATAAIRSLELTLRP